MAFLTLLVVVLLVIDAVSPKAGDAAFRLVSQAMVIPVVTYAAGTLSWLLLNLLTGFGGATELAWLWCCVCVGLPCGMVAGYLLKRWYDAEDSA